MPKKPISTVQDLAALTQAEFLKLEAKVDGGLAAVNSTLKMVVDILDLMRADIHDVKVTLGGLVRTVTVLEESLQQLDKRVTRLEEKAASRN